MLSHNRDAVVEIAACVNAHQVNPVPPLIRWYMQVMGQVEALPVCLGEVHLSCLHTSVCAVGCMPRHADESVIGWVVLCDLML